MLARVKRTLFFARQALLLVALFWLAPNVLQVIWTLGTLGHGVRYFQFTGPSAGFCSANAPCGFSDAKRP